MRHVSIVITLVSLVFVASAADEWTRFRGPNGNGTADGTDVTLKWSKSQNLAWSVEVPGTGHSSPIVAKGKVIVQSASKDGSERLLQAFDATTGNKAWTVKYKAQTAHIHKLNSLASATAAADADRIYTIVWTGDAVVVHAVDYDGKDLWQTKLGGYVSQHGASMSPVAFAGKVYVNYDQDGAAQFVCLDGKTGQQKWAVDRKAFRACCSSPLVRTLADGKSEIINASTAGLTGYDPETGTIHWNWEWKFDGMALRTVGSPILVGDTIVAVSGDGSGARSTVALSLAGSPRMMWNMTKQSPYVPGPIAVGEHVYWVTDDGHATCVELKTGKLVWRERVLQKAVSASPILVGGTILAIDQSGKSVAFQAIPAGLNLVAESDVGESVFATPAVSNGKLYIRGGDHLFCIAKK